MEMKGVPVGQVIFLPIPDQFYDSDFDYIQDKRGLVWVLGQRCQKL